MKISKKILIFIILLALCTSTLSSLINKNSCVTAQIIPQKVIKVVVLLSSFNDDYISLVRENLEKIQKQNSGKIEFIFFDEKNNEDIQNEIVDSLLETDFDLLLANLVNIDSSNIESFINKVKQKNVPVILFNVAPFITTSIKSYSKAFVVATDAKQSGILQGNLIVNEWNNNKSIMDKNKDNVLQYIMLSNKNSNTLNTARAKYSISTINEADIKTQELTNLVSNGTKESAQEVIEAALLKYDNKIEVIIANDDTMAIGAVNALKKYGYNLGTKSIPVVGINAIPEARELIKRGAMFGTVVQDPAAMTDALYKVGINLVYNKPPLSGTNYKFNETGFIIEMPYSEYKQ